jgi:plastocyanin
MVKWTTLLIIVAVIIVAVIGFRMLTKPAIPSTQSNTESAASANTEVREGIIEVQITDSGFVPAEVKIRKNSKVTWFNSDKSPHTATSDSGGESGIGSGILASGNSYGQVFNKTGVFNYHCDFHKNMKGKIVVVE